MPWVKRDVNGGIAGYVRHPAEGFPEHIEGDIELSLTEAMYSAAIQEALDKKARSLGYENIFTAATYADEAEVSKFQTEGRALRKWRSLSWKYVYDVLDQVNAGLMSQPTIENLVNGMPNYEQ